MIYATFHGAHYNYVVSETIVIPLHEESWVKNIVLKIKNFRRIYGNSKPLTASLKYYHKIEAACTIFISEDSWSLLLGEHKIVYPKNGGSTLFCATHFFVKEPDLFDRYMKTVNAVRYEGHVYSYASTMIYLDSYDIPYPGGEYFSPANKPSPWFRVCFLTDDLRQIERLEVELQDRQGVWSLPSKLGCVESHISPFLDLKPVTEVHLPEKYYESTNIVLKKKSLKHSDFIIQDILDTFKKFNDVGILLEYPVRISYFAEEAPKDSRQFYALSINCNVPKIVLYVPAPYDRYFQYRLTSKNIPWSSIAYDHEPTPNGLESVVMDGNTLGYLYRDTFFCLNEPKLPVVTHVHHRNLDGLFRKLTFDLKSDESLKIVNTFRYDSQHLIYCVKHREIRHELWCLGDYNSRIAYPKPYTPPYLVREWAELLVTYGHRCANFGDLDLVKLMYVLARHRICFLTVETRPEERDLTFENYTDIVFRVEPDVLRFINSVRLDLTDQERLPNATQSEGCVIQ